MKKSKALYLATGFVIGVLYVSCNGAQVANSIAATIGNAIDVVFDNTSSGLTATTVQGAIDEVASSVDGINTRVTSLEGSELADLLIGAWTGTEYCEHCDQSETYETSFTFNADGTYSCANSGEDVSSNYDDICDGATS